MVLLTTCYYLLLTIQEYVYDSNIFVGVRLRKFFGLGEGRLVPVSALQGLWRKQFDPAQVKPVILLPRGKESAAEPKLKRSHEHNLEHFAAKRRRVRVKEQRDAEEVEREVAEEWKRVEKQTTFPCDFAGCRHRPFLTKQGAEAHSSSCMYSGKGVRQPNECRVKLRVRVGMRVQASLQVQQSRVALQLSTTFERTTSALKVQRPEQPDRQYGLQPHTSLVAHRSTEARSSAASTISCKHVHVALQVRHVCRL